MEEKIIIKEWDFEDQPREKLMLKGKGSLSDAELIAILIRSGNTDETALDLSKRILRACERNLSILSKWSVHDLKQFKGMGEAKALSIIAAMELGKRRLASKVMHRKSIRSSEDAFHLLQTELSDSEHEQFWVVFLNRANKIISKSKLSSGGISGTVVDIRMILKEAIRLLSSSMIICHNHPSGNLKPSRADLELTKQLTEAASLFDIKVLDHIIIGGDGYISLADEGMM